MLNYLKSVLGINEVLIPEVGSGVLSCVFFLSKKPTPAESDLLEKMIAAMKLKKSAYSVYVETLPELEARWLVSFGKTSGTLNAARKVELAELSQVLEAPGLKKQIWSELQNIMKDLDQST